MGTVPNKARAEADGGGVSARQEDHPRGRGGAPLPRRRGHGTGEFESSTYDFTLMVDKRIMVRVGQSEWDDNKILGHQMGHLISKF